VHDFNKTINSLQTVKEKLDSISNIGEEERKAIESFQKAIDKKIEETNEFIKSIKIVKY
jgi:hypothetical protein